MTQKQRETKVAAFIPTSIDEDQGLVDHIVTVFGIVDEGNDVSHPGAFSKTVTERAGRIRVLDMHNQGSIFSALGVPKRLWEVGRAGLPQKVQAEWPEATGGLMATTQFLLDTPEGKGAFSRIKAGAINEFSYTYDALDTDYGKVKTKEGKVVTVRNLRAVRLWEYGPVIWGMNQATGVVDAKKLGGSEGKPYIKVKEGDKWVVYKEDADKKPVGDPLGEHPTEEEADAQLAALYASMKDEGKAADASLEDAMKGVCVAFNAQFTDGSAETYAMPTAPWVMRTYDTYIIAEYEGKVYQVNYRGTEGQYDFDTRDKWVEVEQSWTPVSTGAPEPEVTAADSHVDPNVPKGRKYGEDQERDEQGRWTGSGGSAGTGERIGYHATLASRVDKIVKEGLKPKDPNSGNFRSSLRGDRIDQPAGVYFGGTLAGAKAWAEELAANSGRDEIAIFKVSVPTGSTHRDPEDRGAFYSTRAIKPEDILSASYYVAEGGSFPGFTELRSDKASGEDEEGVYVVVFLPAKASKYSDDQERDEAGRFGAGGGGGESGGGSGGSGGTLGSLTTSSRDDGVKPLSGTAANRISSRVERSLRGIQSSFSIPSPKVEYGGRGDDASHLFNVTMTIDGVKDEGDAKDVAMDVLEPEGETLASAEGYSSGIDVVSVNFADGKAEVEAQIWVYTPLSGKSRRKAGRVLAARNVARITGAVQALAAALSEVGVIIKVEAQAAAEAPADDADEPKAGKAAGPNPQGSPTTTDADKLRLIEVGIAELDLL